MARMDQAQNADDFLEKLVTVNRVAKVVKGGRQFGFTALTVVVLKPGTIECDGIDAGWFGHRNRINVCRSHE